jgi:hypothetical protein
VNVSPVEVTELTVREEKPPLCSFATTTMMTSFELVVVKVREPDCDPENEPVLEPSRAIVGVTDGQFVMVTGT